ncbi:hypothetical protein [Butyrivibrio sp. AE3004]|uniref:hypothetical protein n=1 Tax=Butyrivibrio sp. AE3004 TaxID=1506994 RepID=UPI0004949A17|nr:hypothetical protein [Butyrivibrio sp. AE3004]
MTKVITAKLTLAVRLLDTTTGREITETDLHFMIDGERVIPMKKESAVFVFVNLCKEDFLMQINVYGYDEMTMQVKTNELDHRFPMLDVFLMPSEKNRLGGDVLKITGNLSGLEYIEAISLSRPIGIFHSEASKRDVYKMNLLPLVPGGGVRLDLMKYAIFNEAEGRYDCFEVKGRDTENSFILTEKLQNEHRPNDKIYRLIYGRAGPGDRFTLKVRDEGESLPYLIRFGIDGKEYFRKLDFHLEAGEINLLKGSDKEKSLDWKDGEKDE